MFHLYVAEMMQYVNSTKLADKAVDPLDVLDRYWEQRPKWPYLIVADGVVAGFCLLRHYPGEDDTIDIDQYYVAEQFRRNGVGLCSLVEAVNMHPGNWLIRVLKTNTKAFRFWVSAVEQCVGEAYEISDEDTAMHFIRFRT